jgi:hypothetical protein
VELDNSAKLTIAFRKRILGLFCKYATGMAIMPDRIIQNENKD